MEPFTPTTTEGIERANRFLSLRSHPGFNDFVRLSQQLVNEATEALITFPGWDKDQIAVLKARAQAAFEHHQQLFIRMSSAIENGVAEAASKINSLPPKSTREMIEEGDRVRAEVITTGLETGLLQEDNRVSGSY